MAVSKDLLDATMAALRPQLEAAFFESSSILVRKDPAAHLTGAFERALTPKVGEFVRSKVRPRFAGKVIEVREEAGEFIYIDQKFGVRCVGNISDFEICEPAP